MYKNYKDISDVVSLLVYCPSEHVYLLTKENSGEYWIPSSKSVKDCWKMTAHQLNFELFGMDASPQCHPLRVYKIWLPGHVPSCVYHTVYKVAIKSDVKKRTKLRGGIRNRLQWFTAAEIERQRVHSALRSPELSAFAQMAIGDIPKDNNLEIERGMLVEICEDNLLVGADVTGSVIALTSPYSQLLQAAGYTKDDQVRLYREFISMVYPAVYMSLNVFTQFMVDHGWERTQCSSLFRAADINNRGGLSFLEVLLWAAALEPNTQHTGVAADIRCRYIFRYFDSNRDSKLDYVELKELLAAARSARQLSIDAISVTRDADLCLKHLGLNANAPLPLTDFLRGVEVQYVRGTSALLRSPSSLSEHLRDLQARDHHKSISNLKPVTNQVDDIDALAEMRNKSTDGPLEQMSEHARIPCSRTSSAQGDYTLATCVVRLNRFLSPEIMHLNTFDEDAVSMSTARLISTCPNSLEQLGVNALPAEAFAAIRYFSTAVDKPLHKRTSGGGSVTQNKDAFKWLAPTEEAALGSLLLRLAEAVRPICMNEPRLLRLTSPVYAIGDLHGNLAALLAMEAALWPKGTALVPAHLLFLGDYVDRGPHGTELMTYLLAAKLQRPHSVHLIRGNHETRDIQKMFTFYSECINKYGEIEGLRIWNAINQVFDALALAAVIDDKVFCCHGGIPPPWVCPLISAIDKIPVPLSHPNEHSSIAWELLWNDPIKASKVTASMAVELSANEGFASNTRRGAGHVFDVRALTRFLRDNRLALVLRAHELHPQGFMCQLRGRLVSVFSSSRYCGGANDSCIALLRRNKLRLIRVTD